MEFDSYGGRYLPMPAAAVRAVPIPHERLATL
jgi:hypothetical protein